MKEIKNYKIIIFFVIVIIMALLSKIIQENDKKNNIKLDKNNIIVKEEIYKEHKKKFEESDKININEAEREELETLEGIGEKIANKIIEYREEHKFKNIEEIKNVSGIGEAKFLKIKSSICID